MRLRKNVGVGVAILALTVLMAGPRAEGDHREDKKDRDRDRTIRIKATATSTFSTSPITLKAADPPPEDPLADRANHAIYAGHSNLGRFTGQGMSQSAPTGRTCNLPDGSSGIELSLVDHWAVSRFERTGDLLLERGEPGSLVACLNLATGEFHEEGFVNIVGGTGRFSGATGREEVVVDGRLVVPFATPGSQGFFGFSTGTFDFDVTVPR
jgi:hypothetical protein